jgi:hypothetical protein
MNEEMMRKITAQPTGPAMVRSLAPEPQPLNGSMKTAPSIQKAFQASRELDAEQNAKYAVEKAAREEAWRKKVESERPVQELLTRKLRGE